MGLKPFPVNADFPSCWVPWSKVPRYVYACARTQTQTHTKTHIHTRTRAQEQAKAQTQKKKSFNGKSLNDEQDYEHSNSDIRKKEKRA